MLKMNAQQLESNGQVPVNSMEIRDQRVNWIHFDIKLMTFLILLLTLQFTLVSANERTVKVKESQSSATLISQSSASVDQAKTTNSEDQIDSTKTNNSELEVGRVAHYKKLEENLPLTDSLLDSNSGSNNRLDNRIEVPSTKKRTMTKQQSLNHDFFFNSVYVSLDVDSDNDGYYSEFTVNFDADTNFNRATVYARLYLSQNGGPWELYHTTRNFNIEGYSGYDDFTVSTVLTSGYPPESYDILIDLYDEYDNSLVATISADNDYELSNVYLEDVTYENALSNYSDYSIYSASITLLTDNDLDGYYQSFSLQFDADVNFGDSLIYAEIWIRDSSGTWSLEHTTEDFLIEGYSTTDTFILESVLESGYRTGYYDFRIDIFDAYTNAYLASSDNNSFQLSDVPLEDSISDKSVSSGGYDSYPSSESFESGGAGSVEFSILLLMLFSVYFKRLYRARTA